MFKITIVVKRKIGLFFTIIILLQVILFPDFSTIYPDSGFSKIS
jgi:hypothetical protein